MPRNTPCRVYRLQETTTKMCLGACVQFDDSADEEDEYDISMVDGTRDIQRWLNDVTALQAEMRQLEAAIRAASSVPALCAAGSSSSSDTDSEYSALSPMTPASSSVENTVFTNVAKSAEPNWKLSIVGGTVRLETSIRSIDELLQFSQASFRYLSPFSSLFANESVVFESTSAHVVSTALRLVSRQSLRHSRMQLLPVELPIMYDYRSIIDKLVNLHIECHSNRIPLLHAPTFMTYYRSLDDPLKSPVVMAVCVNMLGSFRRGIDYTAQEKRQLSDFFYQKCRDLLLDMFDDPDRRLETVITISLLVTYVSLIRLQFAEARRLATIASLIAKDIESSGLDHMQKYERALFQRHRAHVEHNMKMLSMLLDETDDHIPCGEPMEALDDESKENHEFIGALNHLGRLAQSPYIHQTMPHIRRLIRGIPSEVNLDLVLRYETVVCEWWSTLPEDLRFCNNPFSPEVFEKLDFVDNELQFMVFGFTHCMNMMVHANMLSPRSPQNNGQAEEILEVIRQRAINMTVQSCDMLLAVLNRWTQLDMNKEMMPLIVMGHVMYSLLCISVIPQAQIPERLKSNFYRLFDEVASFLPADHHVPSTISPILSFMSNKEASELQVYYEYALPGIAFVSDIMDSSLQHIQTHIPLRV
ncbi:hypothetical protein RO3G_05069 [Lichtheimia corymbifera JMRC:FSU:9682]|uniref:Uncharacterized protein n=1 Tax=Lichtheimia corymbifera JMRC:FSU:9682 TaxID=1263082 RepID=A0A068S822_9FUNG|nr:hypothetical protein RO3G_05069 [Lichtheimia corymbifera JMRC:FSU:9682]